MTGNRKKKPLKGLQARKAARAEKRKKRGLESSAGREERQYKESKVNVGLFIKFIHDEFKASGVYVSLIEILKTVRHWPDQIEEAGIEDFVPVFKATGISAEKLTRDGNVFTNVSFTYSGEVYDFEHLVSETEPVTEGEPDDSSLATIMLHENGKKVINMEIMQIPSQDLYAYKSLNFVSIGSWVDNMHRIKFEIESHGESGE